MKVKPGYLLLFLLMSLFSRSLLADDEMDTVANPNTGYYFITPAEGSRINGPVTLRIQPAQIARGWVPYILARISHASGREEMVLGKERLELSGTANEVRHIRAEAFLEDPSGKRFFLGSVDFFMDPTTVHISSFAHNNEKPDGSREKPYPFSYLDDALAFLKNQEAIQMHGTIRVRSHLVISEDTVIIGSYDDETLLVLDEGASVTVTGKRLNLSSLNIVSISKRQPLIRVERGGGLFLANVNWNHEGVLLDIGDGCDFTYTGGSLVGRNQGFTRFPLINADKARVRLEGLGITLDGEQSLALEIRGGTLMVSDSDFSLKGQRTASALSLYSTDGEFKNCRFYTEAGDYASILELRDSKVSLSGGSLSAKARDGLIVMLYRSAAVFFGATFELSSSFVARAMEISEVFPVVSYCTFIFTGNSRESEVFSSGSPAALLRRQLQPAGTRRSATAAIPAKGIVAQNSFTGFRYIMGKDFTSENILAFNRSFAPAGEENIIGSKP